MRKNRIQSTEGTPFNDLQTSQRPGRYEDEDKENIPMLQAPLQLSERVDVMDDKRRATESYRHVMADVDMDEDTSMTNQDSQQLRELLSPQPQVQGRKSSSSTSNRISDVDENQTFLTGRRDTADLELLEELKRFVQ